MMLLTSLALLALLVTLWCLEGLRRGFFSALDTYLEALLAAKVPSYRKPKFYIPKSWSGLSEFEADILIGANC